MVRLGVVDLCVNFSGFDTSFEPVTLPGEGHDVSSFEDAIDSCVDESKIF